MKEVAFLGERMKFVTFVCFRSMPNIKTSFTAAVCSSPQISHMSSKKWLAALLEKLSHPGLFVSEILRRAQGI